LFPGVMQFSAKVLTLLLATAQANAFLLSTTHTNSFQLLSAVDEENTGDTTIKLPNCVVSPVLEQVYPALIAHKEEFGNPNIPLGSSDGKRCKTLRRLHFQNKLTAAETELLTDIGFRFHSFEDVYYECDFDEMLAKLLDYQQEFQTFQIPKKYDPDPELGAWVTMLRRLKRTDDLPDDQVSKLDAVEFEWVSTRKCGSSFMSKYREIFDELNEVAEGGGDIEEYLSSNVEIMKWIDAQRKAYENGKLSTSRVQYMDELPGVCWKKD